MSEYEKKQYGLCKEWLEFVIGCFAEDNTSVQQYNVSLAQIMTSMEHAFDIPILDDEFVVWSLDHPEIADLYREVSDLRNFNIYPNADDTGIDTDDDIPFVDIICNNGVDFERITVYTKNDFVKVVDYFNRKYARSDYRLSYRGNIGNLLDDD